jgi:hypothetical protein
MFRERHRLGAAPRTDGREREAHGVAARPCRARADEVGAISEGNSCRKDGASVGIRYTARPMTTVGTAAAWRLRPVSMDDGVRPTPDDGGRRRWAIADGRCPMVDGR